MPLRIANAAGFWGDSLAAPRTTVERAAAGGAPLDYITLEYLAELTMSILARQRQKDPRSGFVTDFSTVLTDLLPALAAQPQLKIITNAGGINPLACAAATAAILRSAGLGETLVGVVSGDDLMPQLPQLREDGLPLINLDTGQPLSTLNRPVMAANAYLGAEPIAAALVAGASIVITGRVADASLTLGPALHEFGWPRDDWNRLAGASVAGHLIECGAQATGGLFRDWQNLNLAEVGYPIAELESDGSSVITKSAGTGGTVTVATVAEQLVYEIGDPRAYLTPDVTVDFTTVELAQLGPDRVAVRGATGIAATDSYKVSLAYESGFAASGQLLVWGRDCAAKARVCAEIIRARLHAAGYTPAEFHVECLGANEGVPGLRPPPTDQFETVLRVTVHDDNRAAVERFTREFAPLITSGPPGLAGYAAGRPEVRPILAYWPTLIPKNLVQPQVVVRAAKEMK